MLLPPHLMPEPWLASQLEIRLSKPLHWTYTDLESGEFKS